MFEWFLSGVCVCVYRSQWMLVVLAITVMDPLLLDQFEMHDPLFPLPTPYLSALLDMIHVKQKRYRDSHFCQNTVYLLTSLNHIVELSSVKLLHYLHKVKQTRKKHLRDMRNIVHFNMQDEWEDANRYLILMLCVFGIWKDMNSVWFLCHPNTGSLKEHNYSHWES